MKIEIYTVYDNKAEIYKHPMFVLNNAAAIRSFTDIRNNPETDVYKHPEDYSLFHIGSWDDNDGKLTTNPPKHMISAHEIPLLTLPSELEQAIERTIADIEAKYSRDLEKNYVPRNHWDILSDQVATVADNNMLHMQQLSEIREKLGDDDASIQ